MKNNSFIKSLIIFLILNFAALGIGGFFTGAGVSSDWYQSLLKAPWTPPGWVFGTAWTLIMICYAVYMAFLWNAEKNTKKLIGLFVVQFVLNVIWNPVFFKFHAVSLGLVVISLLTLLILFFFTSYFKILKAKSYLILPYLVWLIIATSLNAYILVSN